VVIVIENNIASIWFPSNNCNWSKVDKVTYVSDRYTELSLHLNQVYY